MANIEQQGLEKNPPEHHERPMLATEDRNSSSPFYNQPIWWCADCHLKVPRGKAMPYFQNETQS